MTNTIGQVTSSNGSSAAGTLSTSSNAATTDLLSSFKDILSSMMLTSSGLSSGQQSNSGMSDMMTSLMMIVLLEKLVEGQVDQGTSTTATAQTAASTAAATTTTATTSAQESKPVPSGRPVGGVLTQDYHPGHTGLDFGVPLGTQVKATMDGNVVYAGWNDQGYGNLVIVENGDYRTYYAHLSSIPVAVGDSVTAGSTIGLSGSTGNSTGPHVHYEIRKNKVPIDPTSMTLGTGT